MSITDFVLGQAMAAAERVINAHEKITLSAADCTRSWILQNLLRS
jgi:uncharacterized protein (DUF1778 family)